MVKLTPEQQRTFIEKAPEVFRGSSGASGQAGLHERLSARREGDHCAHCARVCGEERQKTQNKKLRKTPEVPTSNIQPPMIQINAVRDSRHGSVLEKCVLECWLKRAGVSLANEKLRSDFKLGGAMDFHVYPAALCQ